MANGRVIKLIAKILVWIRNHKNTHIEKFDINCNLKMANLRIE